MMTKKTKKQIQSLHDKILDLAKNSPNEAIRRKAAALLRNSLQQGQKKR
ncbi:Hypothetical protein NGAL_HAMBI490_59610 [Neorhizobium galegae bv. officinalis]|nr:Hypothetical protein NGAL_HAMBI490_59610 [Neorhizobium galegae bv. officinalis]